MPSPTELRSEGWAFASLWWQDVATLKAHPFYGRLDWSLLLAKQMPSPLLQSVEIVSHARHAKQQRQVLDSTERDVLPSSLSQQSAALVDDWDYVTPIS